MSWESVVLGDVTDTLKGFAFKSTNYSESGIKIVRVSDFTSDSISDIDIKHYPKDSVDKYQKYLLKRDDVLIQTVGSWPNNASSVVGKVVKVPKALDGSLLNQNIVKIYPKSNQTLDNKFLYYCLKSDSFQDHNVGNAVGAANQASITLESIKTYCFNLPPLSIQRRIADILSAYDDLIENNQRQIKLLEEAAMRLYREWFVFMRFPGYEGVRIEDGVPEGWEVKQINDVCLNCASGGTPSRKRREYWADGSVNWFKTQELVDSWLFDA
ncbi:MAG: restriction endonuclease subunit S, partial [Methanocorpusculum sp.]|nr:restriction endonuclease subunit S [Methanocorpusculum sp.]